jgi:hypothetical protein
MKALAPIKSYDQGYRVLKVGQTPRSNGQGQGIK